MKNPFSLTLAIILVSIILFVGCSSPAPSPAPIQTSKPPTTTAPVQTSSLLTTAAPITTSTTKPASTPAATSTAAPIGQVIKLKYADQNPDTAHSAKDCAIPWIKQVEAATNGRIQIEPYWSQSLCKGTEAWEATKNGVADIGWMFHGNWANLTPLADVISLPMLPFTSAKQSSGIFWQLYEKYPTFRDQFKDNHPLLVFTSEPYFLITTKKQVKTLADWQGLKLRVTAGPPTDMAKAFGAVPLNMGMPDTYMNLQKGVLDGMLAEWNALLSFKQWEVVKYYTYAPTVTVYFSISMNNAKWNSLPDDVKKQLESVSGLKGSTYWGEKRSDDGGVLAKSIMKEQNIPREEYTVPADEVAKMAAIGGQPIWDAWVKKMTAEGHPEAKEILNTTLDLIKTYKP